MNSKRPTRPTPREKRRPWQWREGPVDERLEHFELRYGKAFESGVWDNWTQVAIVSRNRRGLVNVRFLINKDDPRTSKMVEDTVKELNFYIIELKEEDPWRYLRYHCTTMADVHSSVHWSFIKGATKTAKRQNVQSH